MTAAQLTLDDLRPWIVQRFDRSAGPGGQHVNKVSTRVTLLFDLPACTLLSDAQRARVAAALATRTGRDGRVRIVSQSQRSQSANRQTAEERLLALIRAALRPRRARRATRPTAASRERRLAAKRRRGEQKRLRGGDVS